MSVTRYRFVENQVLELYRQMGKIKFPINPSDISLPFDNCRFMSYAHLAKISSVSVSDIIGLCNSESGCTHYDISHDRYLILYNDSPDIPVGRIRWTKGHELGHIVCGHILMIPESKIAESKFGISEYKDLESEADYFSATFLSPFPLFEVLQVKSPIDVQNVFGLSVEASINRYRAYLYWRQNRIKSSWENDLKNTYNLLKE